MAPMMTRKYTNHLLELMDEGILDPKTVAQMALIYMSEDDVADMCQHNDLDIFEEYPEEGEWDPDRDPAVRFAEACGWKQ